MLHKWQFGAALSDSDPPKSSSAFWALQQFLVALADSRRDFLSLGNGAAVTGEGTGTN